MAQSERFYFWRGYYDAIMKLPDAASRDAFVMAICRYAFDGEEPDFGGNPMLDFAWSIVADQVHESVAIGREMSERGRRSGESRRRKSGGGEQRSNTVPNSVPNEGKGTDRKGSDLPPSGEGVAVAAGAAPLRPDESDAERILRVYGPQPDIPPQRDG